MRHEFTAAAERVFHWASGWSTGNACDELNAETLLVGLLAEPECRAATMLARAHIDLAAVRRHWPALVETTDYLSGGGVKPFSQDVEFSLQLATQRLTAFPQPIELTTEEILLGLASADHEVAVWLNEQGIKADALEAEIRALYGFPAQSATVEVVEWEDETPPVSESPPSRPKAARGVANVSKNREPLAGHSRTFAGVTTTVAALRILDAAANRAREGLRVVEDYARFVLDDRHLTGLCKDIRHELAAALASVPREHRLAARETQADVGTGLTTNSEQSRADAAGVLAANFARVEESFRSIEEFNKLLDVDAAAAIKQLRYRAYTLERAFDITDRSLARLAGVGLYVLIDGGESAEAFDRLVGTLVEACVPLLQLRDKRLGDRELLDRAHRLHELTSGGKTRWIMNDRPDLASLAGADGVHVGQDELTVKDARAIVGPERLVGVSTHSIEQARQAVLDGADYLGVGPTFPSGTKRFQRFPGVELLRAVASEIRLPAFAIGGITRENVAEILAAGLTRVAVGAAVTASDDPGRAAQAFLAGLSRPADLR